MIVETAMIISGAAAVTGVAAYYIHEPRYVWDDWGPGPMLHRMANATIVAAGLVTFLRGIGVV